MISDKYQLKGFIYILKNASKDELIDMLTLILKEVDGRK